MKDARNAKHPQKTAFHKLRLEVWLGRQEDAEKFLAVRRGR